MPCWHHRDWSCTTQNKRVTCSSGSNSPYQYQNGLLVFSTKGTSGKLHRCQKRNPSTKCLKFKNRVARNCLTSRTGNHQHQQLFLKCLYRWTDRIQMYIAIGPPQKDVWQLNWHTYGPILFPVFVPCTYVTYKLPTILLASYISFHTIYMFQSNQSSILPSNDGPIPISSTWCQILFFKCQCQRSPFSQHERRKVVSSLNSRKQSMEQNWINTKRYKLKHCWTLECVTPPSLVKAWRNVMRFLLKVVKY